MDESNKLKVRWRVSRFEWCDTDAKTFTFIVMAWNHIYHKKDINEDSQ